MLTRLLFVPLMLAVSLLLAGCKDVLFSRLTEAQANEVLAALSEARIEASKERVDDSAWQVLVDDARLGAALVYLRNRGLPSRPSASLGEVFKKEGMISSPMEERARYAYALQEDIAATIRRIDGVVDARVHIALPNNDPLATRVVPVSASVFIKHRNSLDIDMLGPNIKAMVMAGVEGLDFRNVALVALPVESAAPAEPTPAGQRTGFMSVQAATLAPAGGSPTSSDVDWIVSLSALLIAAAVLAWVVRLRRGMPHKSWSAAVESVPAATPRGAVFSVDTVGREPVAATAAKRMAVSAPSPSPSAHPGLFDLPPAARLPQGPVR